ncbi:MAG: hypothetical protein KDD62_10080, partial [Bdellovibrionales bacterium]|nr:hypothetical protein [Bdellovibrionales bacterium]
MNSKQLFEALKYGPGLVLAVVVTALLCLALDLSGLLTTTQLELLSILLVVALWVLFARVLKNAPSFNRFWLGLANRLDFDPSLHFDDFKPDSNSASFNATISIKNNGSKTINAYRMLLWIPRHFVPR